MAFKIAYCAGHYLDTPGKRLPKELDTAQTREWVLNDRVARHFARAASQYEGVALLRTDDSTGKTFIDIPERTAKANAWGADLYLDLHHNAAGKIFSGGGVVAFCYPGSAGGRKYRDAIYEAVIAAGGLKGNRSVPLQEKKFDSLSMTNMPAVLMEYGFMDSSTDAPIILTDAYSKLVAYATMEGIAKVAGLKKKDAALSAPDVYKPTVKQWQNAAIADGYKFPKHGADGVWGAECDSVASKAVVKKRIIHTNKNLTRIVQRVVGVDADGLCGAKTDAAIREYQKANGLTVDGAVGINSWKKMLSIK